MRLEQDILRVEAATEIELLGGEGGNDFDVDRWTGANEDSFTSGVGDNLVQGSCNDRRGEVHTGGRLLGGALDVGEVGMTLERSGRGEGRAKVEDMERDKGNDLFRQAK
jgi:hypothetical protein